MLLKLAALGALGYFGYNYYRKNMGGVRPTSANEPSPDLSNPKVAVAGGPLSEQASVVEAGQPLPSG